MAEGIVSIDEQILAELKELNQHYAAVVEALNVVAPAVNWLTENTRGLFEAAAKLQQAGGLQALAGMMGN